VTPPADETVQEVPQQSWQRYRWTLVIVVLLYLVAANVWTQVTADQATEDLGASEEQVDTQQEQVIDPVADACARDTEVRRRLGDLCVKAVEVAQEPARGDTGAKGDPGRGITGTAIVDGRLQVSYTDGVTEDKGPVVGTNGGQGRGVVGSSITSAGRLMLTYTDATTEDAGLVVGPVGGAGEDGAPGRSVSSVTVSPDYHLIVSYDDGTTADAGPLPPGPRGEPGRGVASVAFDFDTCEATVSYTDGTSEQAPMTGCEPTPPLEILPGG
jgi:hypothetical protein